MLAELTMIATQPVDENAVQQATEEGEVQQPQPTQFEHVGNLPNYA